MSLATEISRRFLTGGVDEISVFSTLPQAILTMFAGSTPTQRGIRWLEINFERLGIQAQGSRAVAEKNPSAGSRAMAVSTP